VKKFDIINAIGRRYGLRNYLEVCTPSTGLTFGLVDDGWFTVKHRFVYNCPEHVDDGLAYTYRTAHLSSHEILRTIGTAIGGARPYDVIFIDAWHTLACAQGDLANAWKLLRDGGFMVVHDCNPERQDMTSPEFQVGEWCGVSYRAYIDFVIGRNDLSYCTVDTDYGCGVIRKDPIGHDSDGIVSEADDVLRLGWMIAREDSDTCYNFFHENRPRLLNLVSVDRFREMHSLDEDGRATKKCRKEDT
jgi:hypothetical protein